MCPTIHPVANRAHNLSQQPGDFVCGAVFVTYSRHSSSRKGFGKKDPGYVGMRANKELWWDLCTERNVSFEVVLHYQRHRDSVAEMARDASTRNPQPIFLCPVSYVEFENAWSPSTCQISNRHGWTLALWRRPQWTRTLRKHFENSNCPFCSADTTHLFHTQAQNNGLGWSEYDGYLFRLLE